MIPSSRQPLSAERSPWLRGALRVPGDAAMTHLALLGAALAHGESHIRFGLESTGTAATRRAIAALGAPVRQQGDGTWNIAGLGTGGLLAPDRALEFADDPLAAELIMGLCGTYDFATRFQAGPYVSSQVFDALVDGLRQFGTRLEAADTARLPLTLRGPQLARPTALTLPPGAPATKAALMLAALNVPGRTTLHEAAPGWTHAERLLRRFGATIDVAAGEGGSQSIALAGLPELRAQSLEIPADPSLAALGAVAAAVVPGSEIEAHRVLLNPARTAVLSALVAMGAAIDVRRVWHEGEEEIADLVFRHTPLRGIALAAQHVAPLIDDMALLAVAAAYAEGDSVFYLPAALSVPTQMRLRDLSRALSANGVANALRAESFSISPSGEVAGGQWVETGDPDAALGLLILGMGARRRVTLRDGSVIEKRYPGFVDAFEAIGAGFAREGAMP